jgi:SAM-dependent methyltransferase
MYDDTAALYDLIYELAGKDYAAEAAELVRQVHQRAPAASSLLDVACGTGRHLQLLQASFPDVAGLDASAGMLDVARARLPGTTLVEGDMRAFDLGRTFDVVTCLFSAIGHLATTDELDAAVAAMARHLAPGGVLVVDGWVRPEAWRDGTVHALAGTRDGTAVARVGRSHREGDRSVIELHHLVGTADGIETIVERHELTLFHDDHYRHALRAAGLEVDVVPSPMPGRDRYLAS